MKSVTGFPTDAYGRAMLVVGHWPKETWDAATFKFENPDIFYDPVGIYAENGFRVGGGYGAGSLANQVGAIDGTDTSRIWIGLDGTQIQSNLQQGIWAHQQNITGDPDYPSGNPFNLNQNGGTLYASGTSAGQSRPQFLVNFVVTDPNPTRPTITAGSSLMMNEGDFLNIQGSISDADSGQTLTLDLADATAGSLGGASGASGGSPVGYSHSLGPMDDGTYYYIWSGDDGAGKSATEGVATLTVLNVAPTFTMAPSNPPPCCSVGAVPERRERRSSGLACCRTGRQRMALARSASSDRSPFSSVTWA